MGRWRHTLILCAVACSEVNPLYGLTESGSSGGVDPTTSTAAGTSSIGTTAMVGTSQEASTGGSTTDGVTTGATSSGPGSSSEVSGGLEEHRIFITSAIQMGDFGGVAGADAICSTLAGGADLPTSFRAIVSVEGDAAAERLTVNGPVRTVTDEVVAMDAADLWDGSVDVAVIVDENGDTDVNVGAWTGSSFDGTAMGPNCDDWTDARAQADGIRGQKQSTGTEWLSWGPDNCNKAFHLYCLEQ